MNNPQNMGDVMQQERKPYENAYDEKSIILRFADKLNSVGRTVVIAAIIEAVEIALEEECMAIGVKDNEIIFE